MKRSRFTESQIVAILKEGDAGLAGAQLARKYGISRCNDPLISCSSHNFERDMT